jgi:hypothetical protein
MFLAGPYAGIMGTEVFNLPELQVDEKDSLAICAGGQQ